MFPLFFTTVTIPQNRQKFKSVTWECYVLYKIKEDKDGELFGFN